jgi:hypothetical protein
MFKKFMILRGVLVAANSLCLAQENASAKPVVKEIPIKQTNATSGKEMFNQYCATKSWRRWKGQRSSGKGEEVAADGFDAIDA